MCQDRTQSIATPHLYSVQTWKATIEMPSFHQARLLALALALATHLAPVFSQVPEEDLVPSQDKLVWAAIGDSWAVSTTHSNEYHVSVSLTIQL